MLAILPVLDRVRQMAWMKATMRGMSPAVIGVLAVSLVRLSPAAVPDPLALLILIGTIAVTLAYRVGAFKIMLGGSLLGVVRGQLPLSVFTRPIVPFLEARGISPGAFIAAVGADSPDVVVGHRPGRTRQDEITIFDSSGTALQASPLRWACTRNPAHRDAARWVSSTPDVAVPSSHAMQGRIRGLVP